MTRHRLFYEEPKLVRESLRRARDTAKQIHLFEQDLIRQLFKIDKKRFYVRLGYNSLRSYCERNLGFTRTQSQRIVTAVRRNQVMVNVESDAASYIHSLLIP